MIVFGLHIDTFADFRHFPSWFHWTKTVEIRHQKHFEDVGLSAVAGIGFSNFL